MDWHEFVNELIYEDSFVRSLFVELMIWSIRSVRISEFSWIIFSNEEEFYCFFWSVAFMVFELEFIN